MINHAQGSVARGRRPEGKGKGKGKRKGMDKENGQGIEK